MTTAAPPQYTVPWPGTPPPRYVGNKFSCEQALRLELIYLLID